MDDSFPPRRTVFDPCLLCGKTDDSMVEEYKAIHPGAGVCCGCADIVANVYNYKHGGEYLTWPNVRIPDRYPKKKISATLRRKIFERDLYRCRHCDTHLTLSLDHIIPECRGGASTEDNLQTLCFSCNSKKGKKMPEEVSHVS